MNANKDGAVRERASYALLKAVRDIIVAGGVAVVINYLGANDIITGSAAVAALGVWRVLRPIVLSALPGA